MKKVLGLVALTATLFLASCTSVKPLCATGNSLGAKVGESSATYVFGLPVSNGGDTSISTAAKNGGITQISTVDVKTKNFFLWTVVSTVVTGN